MWYSENLSVWIGTLSIGILALLLALLTLLILKYVSKGKWKQTIFTVQKLSIFLGIIVLVVGIVALIVKQEFHVWYPLCMIGLMLIFIMSPQLLIVSKIPYLIDKKEEKIKEETEKTSKNESIYSLITEDDQPKNTDSSKNI